MQLQELVTIDTNLLTNAIDLFIVQISEHIYMHVFGSWSSAGSPLGRFQAGEILYR